MAGPGETQCRRNSFINRVWNQLNTDIFSIKNAADSRIRTRPYPCPEDTKSRALQSLWTHIVKIPLFTHASTMQNPKTYSASLEGELFVRPKQRPKTHSPPSIVDRGISPFSLWNRNFIDRGLLREEG